MDANADVVVNEPNNNTTTGTITSVGLYVILYISSFLCSRDLILLCKDFDTRYCFK